jgi:hypothetical protein
MNRLSIKKKGLILITLLISFKTLIHYIFFRQPIKKGYSFEECLGNPFNCGHYYTGDYYSFSEHLGFVFNDNYYLYDFFGLYESVNSLWLYIPSTLIIILLIWVLKED